MGYGICFMSALVAVCKSGGSNVLASRPKSWFKDGLHLLMTITVGANFTDSEHGSQDFAHVPPVRDRRSSRTD